MLPLPGFPPRPPLRSPNPSPHQIDVEGFEWAPLLQVFKDLSQQKMSVGQMQVELHTMLEVRV